MNHVPQVTRSAQDILMSMLALPPLPAYLSLKVMAIPALNTISSTFVYDGDGNRVKSTINGVTTYFVGNYYEVVKTDTSTQVNKYYYAGSQRIAMRQDGTLSYLLTDHLGSTSITTDSSGNMISELRYSAWGEVRYQAGTSPTKYTYTGQYDNTADFGLMYYNARWYDPSLGRFAQADSIVPAGVQGYDRYAYVNNNPVNFNDPTGHCPEDDAACRDRLKKTLPKVVGSKCTYHLCSDTNLYELGWENFSQAGSIWTNPNATDGQRFGAGAYMSYWGGAHVAGVVGATLLAWEAIVATSANYFTKNPDAFRVSLGNFPQYKRIGYTYFDAGEKVGNFLDAVGFLKPINQRFMSNQIGQLKPMDVTIVREVGRYTAMEMRMLDSSGLYTMYTQISSDFTGIIHTFTPWIK